MNTKINFSSKFKTGNILSIIFFLLSVLFILFKGLNYGIDFKGGTLIELRLNGIANASDIRSVLNNMNHLPHTEQTVAYKHFEYLHLVQEYQHNSHNCWKRRYNHFHRLHQQLLLKLQILVMYSTHYYIHYTISRLKRCNEPKYFYFSWLYNCIHYYYLIRFYHKFNEIITFG